MKQIAETFCSHKSQKIKQDLDEIEMSEDEFKLLVDMPCEQCYIDGIAMVESVLND